MMSWRCPRPTGVMASTALMPVCSGSVTGCRCTTVGAWSSRMRRPSATISPLSSTGLPSGSTTRPRKPSPTGADRTSPVRRTSWPCSMWAASPRMTQPISRSSRLSASPNRPPSNCSSSLVIVACRPSTRAMPSPVSMTRPTSSRVVSGVYDETYCSIASRISSGRMLSSVMGGAPALSFAALGERLRCVPGCVTGCACRCARVGVRVSVSACGGAGRRASRPGGGPRPGGCGWIRR